jgi:hypothetical protein
MTTPTHAPLQNPMPSSSFLQQLLEEINGSDTPTVLRNRDSPTGTHHARPSPQEDRRASSVWVGGSSVAQDARKKLRAADETRMRRTSVSGHDGTPDVARPILHIETPFFDALSSSSCKSPPSFGPSNPQLSAQVKIAVNGSVAPPAVFDMESLIHDRPDGGQASSGFPMYTMQPSVHRHVTRTGSPLIFCDVDSDLSSSPSPTEPPTSAISTVLTDTTTASDEPPRTSSSSGSHTRVSGLTSTKRHANADHSRETSKEPNYISRDVVEEITDKDGTLDPRSFRSRTSHAPFSLEECWR